MNNLTGKEERVAQGGKPNHQYGAENYASQFEKTRVEWDKNLHGWKDDAWPNDRVVFPNQICTMSQVIDLTVHLLEASCQSVKSSPEKQMDAMPIKNTNSAVIARSALQASSSVRH